MFFREDGSAHDVFLNKRSTGPDLDLFRRVRRSVCVVAGQDKVVPLHAALKSGYISDLFIDERTAQRLVELP
jgi:DNA-binding transcriptional regulator LsrR (DeoR family)